MEELTVYRGWGKEAYAQMVALGRAMEYNQEAIAKVLAKLQKEADCR